MNEWHSQIRAQFSVKPCVLIWGSENMLTSGGKWCIKWLHLACSNSCSPLNLLVSICLPPWTVVQEREFIYEQTWTFQFAWQLHFLWRICTQAFWFIHLFPMTLVNVTQSPESGAWMKWKNGIAGQSQIKLWIDHCSSFPPSGGRPCSPSQPPFLFEVVHLFLSSWEGNLSPSRTLHGALALFSLFLITVTFLWGLSCVFYGLAFFTFIPPWFCLRVFALLFLHSGAIYYLNPWAELPLIHPACLPSVITSQGNLPWLSGWVLSFSSVHSQRAAPSLPSTCPSLMKHLFVW